MLLGKVALGKCGK